MDDLFQTSRAHVEKVDDGLTLLCGRADGTALINALPAILGVSGWRNMQTPGGKTIGVAVTNCGDVGWVSDTTGYRYQPMDPVSGNAWPAMPQSWIALASAAAAECGFDDFVPNACLINRYLPGNRMTSHQDKNEGDFRHPVVTVSTGLPADFLVHGNQRGGSPRVVPVYDGDVMVMGGRARLWYHGVKTLKGPATEDRPHRISLTFRYASAIRR
ncbi:MAG: alpha-ketoglutarate-dependent dioxygenase AlkB [Pseudomonadota bacterium]